ncbi:hypothetical protein pdam_00010523, partial [Pocillopora damicornis]
MIPRNRTKRSPLALRAGIPPTLKHKHNRIKMIASQAELKPSLPFKLRAVIILVAKLSDPRINVFSLTFLYVVSPVSSTLRCPILERGVGGFFSLSVDVKDCAGLVFGLTDEFASVTLYELSPVAIRFNLCHIKSKTLPGNNYFPCSTTCMSQVLRLNFKYFGYS